MQWWKKAANQNSKYAQHNLAVYHWYNYLDKNLSHNAWYSTWQWSNKKSTQEAATQKAITQEEKNRNKDEAVRYWKKAASQGLAAAQYNLANIHWDKIGTAEKTLQDVDEAIRLYEEANEQGHLKSLFYLGRAYMIRKDFEFSESKFVNDWKHLVNLDNDEKLNKFIAHQFFEILASYNLGVAYMTGEGVEKKDLKKSEKLFEKSFDRSFYSYFQSESYKNPKKNFAHANFILGNIYLKIYKKTIFRILDWTGFLDLTEFFGYRRSLYSEAEFYYKMAHQKNYTPAQYSMAFFYWEGKNGRKNRKEAVRLLKIAAGPILKLASHRSPYKNNNYCLAQHALGLIYWWGEGEKRDRSYNWFKKAAAQGLVESYYYLARYHYDKFNELDEKELNESEADKNKSEKNAQGHLEKSYMYYIVSNNLKYERKHTEKQGERVRKILKEELIRNGEATAKIKKIKKDGKNLVNKIKKMKIKNCSSLNP